MKSKQELLNELNNRCLCIRDNKIDIIIKFDFYHECFICLLNKGNFKQIANILKRFNHVSNVILYDIDTEHIIYRKMIYLLNNNEYDKYKSELDSLLFNLNLSYIYRASYLNEYLDYLKMTVDNLNLTFDKELPIINRDYVLKMLKK